MREFIARLAARLGIARGVSDSDAAMVRRLRARGVRIGEDCRIYTKDFSSDPYLVALGDGVCIAGGVKFVTHDGSARLRKSHRPNIQFVGRIDVGANTFIGENAIILPGTNIGRDCVIGAGAVVRGAIPDNSLVVGNPGEIVGRASLMLDRLERSANALDTFNLPAQRRREVLLAHFNITDEPT